MSLFTKVRGLRPKRHLHNLSHDNLISHDLGQIVPCFVMEHALPGSKLSISYSQLSRFQALIAPIMSNVNSYVRFYKVPFRLLDPAWTRFISGEAEFDDSFDYNPAYFTFQGFASAAAENGETLADYFFYGSLMDFLGYTWTGGTQVSSGYTKEQNLRAFQAYLLILKTWFINENLIIQGSDFADFVSLIDDFVPDTYIAGGSGILPVDDMSSALYNILYKLKTISSSMCFPHAWGKDYFTSALPFVQVGEPVRLSMVDTAPVSMPAQAARFDAAPSDNGDLKPIITNATGSDLPTQLTAGLYTTGLDNPKSVINFGSPDNQIIYDEGDNPSIVDVDWHFNRNSGIKLTGFTGRINGATSGSALEGTVDLSEATAVSILELRIANALQSYKELTARIGHRYNEYLKGTWNVDSRDARLQLPERLGGGKIPVNIADIEQTSATAANQSAATDKTPLGWLAGKATAFGAKMSPIKTFIEEDCLIIGLLYTQPKSRNYCLQGINRFKTKLYDRFDFFHPKFEHIGEQAIMTTELYAGAPKTEVFGYQARYAEYKWWPNEVHGQFNSTLDFWHLARKFSSKPTLSPEFIYVQQSEMTRPFAVQSVEGQSLQQCMSWLHFEVAYLAPMSKYGTPMLLN